MKKKHTKKTEKTTQGDPSHRKKIKKKNRREMRHGGNEREKGIKKSQLGVGTESKEDGDKKENMQKKKKKNLKWSPAEAKTPSAAVNTHYSLGRIGKKKKKKRGIGIREKGDYVVFGCTYRGKKRNPT